MAPVPDIGEMTDEELRQRLKDYSVDVGPIVSTTRLFYEKKLGKLIQSGGQPQPETEESEEDYDDEEEEDEEVQINYKAPQLQSTPPRQRRQPMDASPPRQHRQPMDASPPRQRIQPMESRQPRQRPQTAHTPVIQARKAEPTLYSSINSPQSAPPRKQADSSKKPTSSSGGGLGMWIKLLLIIIVAALVYLVIINMNPSADNKIPSRLDDSGV